MASGKRLTVSQPVCPPVRWVCSLPQLCRAGAAVTGGRFSRKLPLPGVTLYLCLDSGHLVPALRPMPVLGGWEGQEPWSGPWGVGRGPPCCLGWEGQRGSPRARGRRLWGAAPQGALVLAYLKLTTWEHTGKSPRRVRRIPNEIEFLDWFHTIRPDCETPTRCHQPEALTNLRHCHPCLLSMPPPSLS